MTLENIIKNVSSETIIAAGIATTTIVGYIITKENNKGQELDIPLFLRKDAPSENTLKLIGYSETAIATAGYFATNSKIMATMTGMTVLMNYLLFHYKPKKIKENTTDLPKNYIQKSEIINETV